MNTDTSKNKQCGYNDFKRTRYFHGMLLSDRDFREEQIYHNEKRKLLNRMLYGWGVVCGLKVKPTNPASTSVIVEPGLALDCHGNEIMVCEEQTVDLSTKLSSLSSGKGIAGECAEYTGGTSKQTASELYIVIRYYESPSDPVPVYAPGGSCEEKTCDYSRTCEGFCIDVLDRLPEGQSLSVLDSTSASNAKSIEPCTEPYSCPKDACCPDPHYIVLARISCGARVDVVVANRITKSDSTEEISFRASRTFNKVCLSTGDEIIVEDVYEFFKKDPIVSVTEWKIDWASLVFPTVSIEKIEEKGIAEQQFFVKYRIKEKTNAATGKVDIDVPISSLKYKVTIEKTIEWTKNELPTFNSPIEIGISNLGQNRTITEALIRNVECRKFVATFPWFAWLYANLKGEKPWSGDLSTHCAAKKTDSLAAEKTITTEVANQVAKVTEDIRQEMQAKIKETEKNAADALKKMENVYNKKLTDLNKTITSLREKGQKRS